MMYIELLRTKLYATFFREFYGIRAQIREHLIEPHFIGNDVCW